MEHFLGLERLSIYDSKVENIFFLNEENGQQMNLGLLDIKLCDLPMMTCLFVGQNNSFSLENLTRINIVRCEKLEYVFSTSILRFLPQLEELRIEECKELKHMIEDDFENKKFSNTKTCFPKLEKLVVENCNKLKYVLPISICKELPALKVLIIREADELKQIFVSEGDGQKVEIPNLKVVVFLNLLSLCETQKNQFKAVEHRIVRNCQKLSLTSTFALNEFDRYPRGIDQNTLAYLRGIQMEQFEKEFKQFEKEFKVHDTSNENPSSKSNEDLATGIEVQMTSKHELTSLQGVEISAEEGTTSTNSKTIAPKAYLELGSSSSGPLVTSDCRTSSQNIEMNVEEGTISTEAKKISSSTHLEVVSSSSGPPVTSECKTSSQLKMKQTPEAEHKLVENVLDFEMSSVALLPTNSKELMDQESMDKKCLMNPQHSLGEVDTTTNPSLGNNLEGSISEITVADNDNEPPLQLDIAPQQKGFEIIVEEGTTSTFGKTITSTHLEDGNGKISIPSFSAVDTKPSATKYADIGDSQETIAMEDINKLIEEDPLLALEKLLTGVQSFSIGSLLQELKTLMDSSPDLDHLVSNHESKSKLFSLFHGLNQHQGILPSDVKEFVEKVQNFFNENIVKHATYQQVLKKHNQFLDSKNDLMNKLWSAKSTQTHIDGETSTANTQIHELSLHIDELRKQLEDLENQRDGLKSVVNKCDVQKMKLKVECTEWAQQSKELLSALASSEVDVREAERAKNLAKEGFANLKSSFPTF